VSLTSTLYRLARLSADVRALRSPATAARRVKNKALGRLLARGGIWRRLWR
jgi:muconolactone delta-isomerase